MSVIVPGPGPAGSHAPFPGAGTPTCAPGPGYLIYDIEVERGPLLRDEVPDPNIAYADGWEDHAHMGVSVIGAYDSVEDRYRVFCKDNFGDFVALATARDLLVGFNSISFDNAVLRHAGIVVPATKCYDLLVETWAALGLGPTFVYPSHAGFGLDAIVKANFRLQKSGHGAQAPIQWQRGEIGAVIDYCLNDVRITRRLFEHVAAGHQVLNPKGGRPLTLRRPT